MSNKNISSNWNGFHRLWLLVAIILLLLLLLLWLLGFGPWGKNCQVAPKVIEKVVQVDKIVDNPDLVSKINLLKKENAKIAGLLTTIKGLESDNAQIPVLKEKLVKLEAENKQAEELKTKFSALESDNSKIAEMMATIKMLKTDNAQIPTLKTKLSGLEDAANKQVSELEEKLNQRKSEDEAKISGLMMKIKSLEAEHVNCPDLTDKLKTLEAGQGKLGALMQEITSLKTALKIRDEKLAKFNDQTSDLDKANSQIKVLETKIQLLTSKNNDVAKLQDKIKQLEAKSSKLGLLQGKAKDFVVTKEELQNLQHQIKQLEAKNKQIPSLEAKITALQNEQSKVTKKPVEKIVKETTEASSSVNSQSLEMGAIPEKAKLFFKVGSSINPMDKNKSLDRVISYLKNNASSKVTLNGYHDPSGNLAKNKALSLARAKSVSRLLTNAGISSTRIVIARPAQTEGTGSPAEARRVEVLITK